jgi:uridine kinase
MRSELVSKIANRILDLPSENVTRVAIDGVDGAGKTHFADELASCLQGQGRPIIRASVDAFHNPRSVRYSQGSSSPEGFYRNSYNYPLLKRLLLDPLSSGGSRRFKKAAFDHRLDSPVDAPQEEAASSAILLFDGIFLHRPELREYWDFSIFLDVDFSVSIPRGAQRGEGSADPVAPSNRRYVEGQRLYLTECQPWKHATVVIDNNVLDRPHFKKDAAYYFNEATDFAAIRSSRC